MEEKWGIYYKDINTRRRKGGLCSKLPTPQRISAKQFKVQVRDAGGGHRVSDRLMHSSLTDGEIIGQCCRGEHSQSLGFRSPGGCMLIIIRYLTSSPW